MKKVSIITVDYNNPELTILLLSSLKRLDLQEIAEVIVVDNGSRKHAGSQIAQNYPWVKFIRSEVNLGFAGGNNLGIRQATGDYLFFINNDTELTEDIITPMVKVFEERPAMGMLSPEIRYFEQPEIIQYSGYTPMNPVTGRNHTIVEPEGRPNGFEDTPFAHGAAMMLSKEVIDKVGEMPENFFLYYEEHDWAEMVKRAGYRVGVLRNVRIYHKESMSVGKINDLKMYFMTRNRILFMRRNYQGWRLPVFWIYFLLIAFPKNFLMLLLKRDFPNLKALLAGVQWNLASPVSSPQLGYKFDYLKHT